MCPAGTVLLFLTVVGLPVKAEDHGEQWWPRLSAGAAAEVRSSPPWLAGGWVLSFGMGFKGFFKSAYRGIHLRPVDAAHAGVERSWGLTTCGLTRIFLGDGLCQKKFCHVQECSGIQGGLIVAVLRCQDFVSLRARHQTVASQKAAKNLK